MSSATKKQATTKSICKTEPWMLPSQLPKRRLFRLNQDKLDQLTNPMAKNLEHSLSFIGKYFNVTTEDVANKMTWALIPLKKDFSEAVASNPDMYGPFWIYITLIFLISLSTNFTGYVLAADREKFAYNVHFIPLSCLIVRY